MHQLFSVTALLLLFLLCPSLSLGAGCGDDEKQVTIVLGDTWGDGWTGFQGGDNTFQFLLNGVPTGDSYTLQKSEGHGCYDNGWLTFRGARCNKGTRQVCLPKGEGNCYSIRVGGGDYTSELRWQVYISDEKVFEGVGPSTDNEYLEHGEKLCASCPKGTKVDGLGCGACPLGSYSDSIDSSACTTCPGGKYADATGQEECIQCAAGKHLDSSDNARDMHDSPNDCASCRPGKISGPGSLACTVCPHNTFQVKSSQSSCDMCPMGKFISSDQESDHDAPDDCKECESGKYPSSGSDTTTCIPCEEGKFSSSPSEMECTTCAPGKYADDPEGSASCVNCAAGKYSGVGAKQCDLCDAGKFATSESQTCINCEAGKFSTQGLGSCTSCTSPQYSNEGASECSLCPAGRYSLHNSCVDCSPGYIRPDPASTAGVAGAGCEACGVNKYSTDKLTCQDCPANTASTQGSSECYIMCTESQLTYENAAGECACKAGFGFNAASCTAFDSNTCDEGETLCKICPVGSFSSEFTQTGTCTLCDSVIANSVNNELGSTTADDCVCASSFIVNVLDSGGKECVCPAGRYRDVDNNICVTCEEGKYKENPGNQETCDSCGAEKTTGGRRGETTPDNCQCKYSFEVDGQGNCVCAMGYGINPLDGTGCEVCTAGRYSDELSLGSCKDCSAGKWGQSLGEDSEQGCTLCVSGKYSTLPAASSSTSCQDCAKGKYLTSDGQATSHDSEDDCKLCIQGKYGMGLGSAACYDCAKGKYQDVAGATEGESSCKDCDMGKYGPNSALISPGLCQLCPAGSWSNRTGIGSVSDCNVCGAGKYTYIMGADSESKCTKCSPGRYISDPGTDASYHHAKADCQKCDRGKYNDVSGSGSCFDCPAATYNAKEGADSVSSCVACPEGSYSSPGLTGQESEATCVVCPKGKYQPLTNFSGELGCTECDEGKTTYPPESSGERINGTFESDINKYEWHNSKESCNISSAGWWVEEGEATKCPNFELACSEGNTCQEGYEDVRCASCALGYYQSGVGCLVCETSTMHWLPHLILVCAGLCVAMVWGLNLKDIQGKTSRHFAALTPRLWKIAAKVVEEHSTSISSKSKVVFSYYQVVLLMGQVYAVEYPPTYQQFEANFDWIGLKLVAEIDCYQKITFMTRLVGTTLGPLIFVAIMLLFGTVSISTTKQQAKKDARKSMVMSAILMVTFVFLPSASFVVFQSFNCDDDNLLKADPTISCDTPEYSLIVLFALVMLVIWPIGIPFSYLYILGGHYGPTAEEMQDQVNRWMSGRFGYKEEEQAKRDAKFAKLDAEAPAYLKVLNAEFEPQCWWMPVFEQYRKLAITGITILLGAGSVDQLIFGMVIAIMAALVYFAVQPYKDFSDDLYSMLAHFQIVLVLLWSLLVKMNKLLEDEGETMSKTLNSDMLGYLLIMTNISVIVFFFIFMFVEYRSVSVSIRARTRWDVLNRKGVRANSIVSQMRRMSNASAGSNPPPREVHGREHRERPQGGGLQDV
eukprot:CAMPEP_0197566268 /NCGR_PEP_ID=MMETSP1320-20131121/33573_1 /TAXON_ID=91990 /ORGANISM="Bolidomonas sp., Strain RCC2347" /LENGTH=1504 /DNA_ID=CAMNT_0043128349 /DNA_START=118 /DNA_END=4628 /DNA_ORIENTATION=+